MTPSKMKIFVLLVCFAHVLSIILFMCGFFPLKSMNLHSEHDESRNRSETGSKIVGRTVLIVVDALRSDFIKDHADKMPYVRRLIQNGIAKHFIAKVNPPTVTMPRIKALTSGTIPGYIDLVLNLGSSEYTEDNLISRATTNGLRVVFYGDDTWIRLFPRHFVRSEGTNSFYVKDFYQVDRNVTRHLDEELRHRHDWNLLVLHYLGLDHIGHTLGPRDPLISVKLKEMDDVFRFVHETLQMSEEKEPPLMIISGDHGMSEYGGHGGASRQETTVPLIFISSAFDGIVINDTEKEVLQIDVAVTLSLLLDLPIPKNSLGRLILPLFSKLDWKNRLALIHSNAIQLESVATLYSDDLTESCFRIFRTAKKQYANWVENGAWNPEDILWNHRRAIVEFSDLVSPRLSRFDGYTMIIAIVLQNITLLFVLWVLGFASHNDKNRFSFKTLILIISALLSLHLFFCWSDFCSGSFLCTLSIFSIVVAIITTIVLATFLSVITTTTFVNLFEKIFQCVASLDFGSQFLLFGCLVHSLSFASTSFIEEEHQTWYFLCTSFLLIRTLTFSRSAIEANNSNETNDRPYLMMLRTVLILVVFRVCRSWNSTGDKWAHLEDIGDWLNRFGNECWLSLAVACSLLLLVSLRSLYHRWAVTAFFGLTCVSTYLYHYAAGAIIIPFFDKSSHNLYTSVVFAKVNYGLIFILAVFAIYTCQSVGERFESLVTVWLALSILLVQSHNVPLVAFWSLAKELYSFKRLIPRSHPGWIITMPFLWLAQASFFQQGYSNSLGKIEVATGFVGLESYNPILVGGLLLCSIYSGPIFWILSLFSIIHQIDDKRIRFNVFYCLLFLLLSRILPWSFYSILVYVQRHHLFIWTVFSPKLIFEAVHSLVFTLIVATISVAVKWLI